MATNHSNIGGYFAAKHLPDITKMLIAANRSKGEDLFGTGGTPESIVRIIRQEMGSEEFQPSSQLYQYVDGNLRSVRAVLRGLV